MRSRTRAFMTPARFYKAITFTSFLPFLFLLAGCKPAFTLPSKLPNAYPVLTRTSITLPATISVPITADDQKTALPAIKITSTDTPAPTNTVAPVFSIPAASHTVPDDIIREIVYGNQGGGGSAGAEPSEQNISCYKSHTSYTAPVVEFSSGVRQLMDEAGIITCGWKSKEDIELTVQFPDKRVKQELLSTTQDGAGNQKTYMAQINFIPELRDPVGKYTFSLTGGNEKLEVSLFYTRPTGPHVYPMNDENLMLYGFWPNEKVRLFAYTVYINETPVRFLLSGWQEYQVDNAGGLPIRVEKGYAYEVVGDTSGEAMTRIYMQNGEIFQVLLGSVLKESKSSPVQKTEKYVCQGAAQIRVNLYDKARVATANGSPLDIHEFPGKSENVIAHLQQNITVFIIDGPLCIDGLNWFLLRFGEKDGWVPESEGGVYNIVTLPKIYQASCMGVLSPRLEIGKQARVTFTDGKPLRVREDARKDSKILAEIPEGTVMTVLEGPRCGDLNWWKVNIGNQVTGWAAEGDDQDYFLEPWQ